MTGLARTRLAKSVHDAGWGMFLRQLSQKTTVVPVDRWFPSTRLCSQCGVIGARKPLGVREGTCPDCGTHLDRDYN
ncbi:transposase, partial [Salmonella enterica subsp. enterica serovar Derby]